MKPTIDHSCSYHCDRPECIKAQRDEMRERLKRLDSQPVPVEPLIVKCMRDPTWCGTEPTQILSYIDTLQSELKRVTEERDKEKEIMTPAENLAYELDGVISDVEKGGCFDGVCLLTIKRVRDALAAGETAPPSGVREGMLRAAEIADEESARIADNASKLKQFEGSENEARCRELCAMYMKEFARELRAEAITREALAKLKEPS